MKRELSHIKAKKSLGQHFLNNSHVPKLMAEAGKVARDEVVLEIGPGTGVLTRELLTRGAKVIAIEADMRAIEILKKNFKSEITAQSLIIIHEDARTLDLRTLGLRPRAYKVIANIPYYLSGMLFRTFLENEIQPSTIVFLVQKEVAERIVRDKKESLLSLSVKVFGEPAYVKTVGKGNFMPQPKIDSAIIAISNISREKLGGVPTKFFFEVLHEGFKSRRKQLLSNLSDSVDRTLLTNIFSTLKIPSTIRGEDLGLANWLKLVKAILVRKNAQNRHQLTTDNP
jgi:16S rRNA (adenine1518-N6/adenine1519-N6)-dimethyltransferase